LDDTLLWNKKVISALCDKISSTRELSGITWGCNARANLTNEELLLKMKHAGCNLIILGVESGDPETLERIKKGIKRETMVSCIDTILAVGIKVTVNLMNGFPWQTMDTVRTQMTFVDALKKRGVSAISAGSTVFPYPGTKLFTEYCGRGYNLYNWWLRDDFFEKNNAASLRMKEKTSFYYNFVPPGIRINDSEDFFGVYKDNAQKHLMESLLNDIREYNMEKGSSRFLKYRKVRLMIRFIGEILFRCSPNAEEWFWKKVSHLSGSI
jgi:radical SAM superfamily enzyme YgiQ (UPF0313 family)